MTTALHPQAEVISAQDASCIPTSGKQTFGLGHFFNGCADRAERGLEMATLAVVEATHRGAVTRAVAPTPPTCATATTQAQETTLVDCHAQQLRAHHHRLPAWVAYHAVDGYVAKKKSLEAVVGLSLHPMTQRRGDADGRFLCTGPQPKRRGAHRQYDGKVRWQDLSRFEALGTLAEAEQMHLYTALVWHVSLQRKLRVVILINRKAPAKPRYIVLASTDLALDGRKLVEWSGARFQLEFLFRDSQQFTAA